MIGIKKIQYLTNMGNREVFNLREVVKVLGVIGYFATSPLRFFKLSNEYYYS